MTYSVAYTLAASTVGLLAALWLCIGTALMRAGTIAELARSYWDYHKEKADVVISQSAQYSVGAILLLFAFGLQIAAALASPNSQANLPPALASPCAWVLSIFVLVFAFSFALYKVLRRSIAPKVHEIIKRSVGES